MPNVSRTSASIHNEFGPGEEYTEHLDDTTVNFVTINEDSDLAPLLVGLPDDKCQCRHWGYLFAGQMTVTYADRVEVINPGDAFYMTPGHSPEGTRRLGVRDVQPEGRAGGPRSPLRCGDAEDAGG